VGLATCSAVDNDELLAVLAHGWLNTMTVIGAAADTLRDHDDLTPAMRAELLDMLRNQSLGIREELAGLVRLARPELQEALDGLSPKARP
jgi:hypothetical protein